MVLARNGARHRIGACPALRALLWAALVLAALAQRPLPCLFVDKGHPLPAFVPLDGQQT